MQCITCDEELRNEWFDSVEGGSHQPRATSSSLPRRGTLDKDRTIEAIDELLSTVLDARAVRCSADELRARVKAPFSEMVDGLPSFQVELQSSGHSISMNTRLYERQVEQRLVLPLVSILAIQWHPATAVAATALTLILINLNFFRLEVRQFVFYAVQRQLLSQITFSAILSALRGPRHVSTAVTMLLVAFAAKGKFYAARGSARRQLLTMVLFHGLTPQLLSLMTLDHPDALEMTAYLLESLLISAEESTLQAANAIASAEAVQRLVQGLIQQGGKPVAFQAASRVYGIVYVPVDRTAIQCISSIVGILAGTGGRAAEAVMLQAVRPLLDMLDSATAADRRCAAWILGELGCSQSSLSLMLEAGVHQQLVQLMASDAAHDVRLAAADALAVMMQTGNDAQRLAMSSQALASACEQQVYHSIGFGRMHQAANHIMGKWPSTGVPITLSFAGIALAMVKLPAHVLLCLFTLLAGMTSSCIRSIQSMLLDHMGFATMLQLLLFVVLRLYRQVLEAQGVPAGVLTYISVKDVVGFFGTDCLLRFVGPAGQASEEGRRTMSTVLWMVCRSFWM